MQYLIILCLCLLQIHAASVPLWSCYRQSSMPPSYSEAIQRNQILSQNSLEQRAECSLSALQNYLQNQFYLFPSNEVLGLSKNCFYYKSLRSLDAESRDLYFSYYELHFYLILMHKIHKLHCIQCIKDYVLNRKGNEYIGRLQELSRNLINSREDAKKTIAVLVRSDVGCRLYLEAGQEAVKWIESQLYTTYYYTPLPVPKHM